MLVRLLFAIAVPLLTACGGGLDLTPEPFTRERADGKIPVKTALIREQVQRQLAGMPEGEAEVLRWQAIEADYHACRLSAKGKKSKVEEAFADCMANRGYVYMYRIDAGHLHDDIAFEMEKAHDARIAAERKAEEERLAAERKAEEERIAAAKQKEEKRLAAERKVEEERIAAERKQQEEKEQARRQEELDDALVLAVFTTADGSVAEIQRLIDEGADITRQDKDKTMLLHVAAEKGYTETALILIKAGLYVDNITKAGQTALHHAAQFGHPETVLALINAGATIDMKSNNGFTPLHYAAIAGQTESALALVKAGANVFARTNELETPLDVAIIMHGKDSGIALFLRGAMEKSSGKKRQQAEELLRKLK